MGPATLLRFEGLGDPSSSSTPQLPRNLLTSPTTAAKFLAISDIISSTTYQPPTAFTKLDN